MSVDFTALRPGTLVHGGGFGLFVEAINAYSAKVMSLGPEDCGQVREWGNQCDVVSEPKSDVDAGVLMRAYNVAGLSESMATVHVKNTEAVWAEYVLTVQVPARLLQDNEAVMREARDRISCGDFHVTTGPDIRATVDGFDQEYELLGIDNPATV